MRGAPARGMDALVSRVRRVGALRALSDPLLLALIGHSEPLPDRVQASVVLFNQGDHTSFWYVLLSGQVDLYLPSPHQKPLFLRTISAGGIFGELGGDYHCCSAVVTKPAEFIKIHQKHFLGIYRKHADHIQPFIIVMQDVLPDERELSSLYQPSTLAVDLPVPPVYGNPSPHRNMENGHTTAQFVENGHDPYDFATLQSELPSTQQNPEPNNIFEFSSVSLDGRMSEAGCILRETMMAKAPHLIRERIMHNTPFSDCMLGSEMVDWLLQLSISVEAHSPTLSRFQITGIWQTLLEHNIICHVTNEQQFSDKHLLYRWVGELGRHDGGYYPSSPRHGGTPCPSREDITSAVFFLSTVGPDALFRMILRKPAFERTPEELELVYEELLHVKALSHLSTMVKRELATVINYEHHTHAGTVLFHQGDVGKNWYIVLKGSVDVSIHGKGVVCSLQEGDDFGKLALVNDVPRAATVALREDDSQFLVVDKYDFNRILRDVEANTVRLKEHDKDVLILEKMSWPRGAAVDMGVAGTSSKGQCCYSVMAGLPEKMIEYVLETRVDAQSEGGDMDIFLEDFILTHIIYMPTNVLCNYLKNYYRRTAQLPCEPARQPNIEYELDVEQCVAARRRVVSFVQLWVKTLGLHYFLDPAANSFIEELYCCVLEDSRRLPGMSSILHVMTSLRQLREEAMRNISRHPCVVLECGVLAAGAPAPHPILPNDTCNQILHLSDTTSLVMSIRMDKTAEDICEMTRSRLRYSQSNEALCLVEVKSGGERVIFSPLDVSIPTLLSLNSKLYIAYKEELNSLVPQPDQNGPVESVHSSAIEFVSSSELAQQLYILHSQLLEACDEIELITQVVGREQFPGRVPSNLDLIMRRFNEVQYWATTEIVLAPGQKRVNTLRKFIKIAMYAKENKDLMSFFAITLGLSNISVSRLTQTWQRLPAKLRRQFAEFESLLDPTRNHRPYRALLAKMTPPYIPFVPLLLKDLTFVHDGNKTYYNGLVNFEKMHMIANVLRSFRECKGRYSHPCFDMNRHPETQNLLRNFRVIDNQRRLMQLSYQIEPKKRRTNNC